MKTKNYTEEGVKYDAGKLRYDLLPPEPVEELVKVLTYGATKYTDGGWKKVEPYKDRYLASTLRHLMAWRMGEVRDNESGLPHLAHAMCCLTFMLWKERNKEKEDVREVLYLSYPYHDSPEYRTEIVKIAAKWIYFRQKKRGEEKPILLIPHLMFGYLNEEKDRIEILKTCVSLVGLCTTFIVLGDHISDGMDLEIKEAKARNIPIEFMDDTPFVGEYSLKEEGVKCKS